MLGTLHKRHSSNPATRSNSRRLRSYREAADYVLHRFGPQRLVHSTSHYIYLLRDPRDKTVRYVGRTKNPKRRYSRHLNDKCDGSYVRLRWDWISELRTMNLRPQMEIVETLYAPIAEDLVSEREYRWIFHFFQQGANLTNVDCIRMPRLFCAGRDSHVDFLSEPLDSPVWENLALSKGEDHAEWMRTNRKLDEAKKRVVNVQKTEKIGKPGIGRQQPNKSFKRTALEW